jgi:hypothetical protein
MRAFLTTFGDNDFSSMGRAIEERYARCKEWWEPHLRCTREFIADHVAPCSRIAVLGAGKLLDLDLPALLEHASEVHLFDADSHCISTWRAAAGPHYRRRVIPHIEDVTGVMESWTQPLKSAARRGVLEEYLSNVEAVEPAWARDGFDAIISLNIAGQIPLYWRDRVLDIKASLTDPEYGALQRSMATLQSAHIRALTADTKALSIVVTDTEYYYYDADHSHWEIETALYGDSAALLEKYFSGEGASCWLWHLAPQYIESDNEGEIHRVEARVRKNIITA